MHTIEVAYNPGERDVVADQVLGFAREAGLQLTRVERIRRFTIDADAPQSALAKLAEALADPLLERAAVDSPLASSAESAYRIEIGLKPRLRDTVGETAMGFGSDVRALRERTINSYSSLSPPRSTAFPPAPSIAAFAPSLKARALMVAFGAAPEPITFP